MNEAVAVLAEKGVLHAITLAKRNRAWEARDLFDLINDFERELATPTDDNEPSLDNYADRKYRHVKRELFGGLPRTILEIGAGDGANFRYLDPGTHVIALEPNRHMHPHLHAAAALHGVTVDLCAGVAERIPLPDGSFEAVIASLVLCSVSDPARVLAEIRRVLRPDGRFWCIEHVAAAEGTMLSRVQRLVRRPWRWLFEGCETQRHTAGLLRGGGFESVEVRPFTLRTAFVPIRSQITAVAVR